MTDQDADQARSAEFEADVAPETDENLEDTIDEDTLGTDPVEAGYTPPDQPFVLDEDGVTGAGMREGDTLDQRLAREEREIDEAAASSPATAPAGAGDDPDPGRG